MDKVPLQTFSCFVWSAIEVNPIAVIVKFMTKRWELIAVMGILTTLVQLLQQFNVMEQQKKAQGAKIERPTPMADVIYTNFNQQFEKLWALITYSQ